jgi:hypothetical protein
LCINEVSNVEVSGTSEEFDSNGSVIFSDLSLLDGMSNLGLESVISIELPNSSVVWLVRDPLTHLMRILEIFHLNDLWSHFVEHSIFCFPLLSSLFSGGVDTKNNLLVLISTSERVENLLWVVEMAVVSHPSWMWDLVIEESRGRSFTELFKSEPFNNVRLLSFTPELLRCPLRVEFVHSVIPSLSWVSVNLPSVSNFGSGPVWDFETLEEGSWSSVERDISYSLQHGLWMEVLSIDVHHNIWLLMELLAIKVLNSNTYIIIILKVGESSTG